MSTFSSFLPYCPLFFLIIINIVIINVVVRPHFPLTASDLNDACQSNKTFKWQRDRKTKRCQARKNVQIRVRIKATKTRLGRFLGYYDSEIYNCVIFLQICSIASSLWSNCVTRQLCNDMTYQKNGPRNLAWTRSLLNINNRKVLFVEIKTKEMGKNDGDIFNYCKLVVVGNIKKEAKM